MSVYFLKQKIFYNIVQLPEKCTSWFRGINSRILLMSLPTHPALWRYKLFVTVVRNFLSYYRFLTICELVMVFCCFSFIIISSKYNTVFTLTWFPVPIKINFNIRQFMERKYKNKKNSK